MLSLLLINIQQALLVYIVTHAIVCVAGRDNLVEYIMNGVIGGDIRWI